MKVFKMIITYQIYDENGNKVYEPFMIRESAEFMAEYSKIVNYSIIEIEEVLNDDY